MHIGEEQNRNRKIAADGRKREIGCLTEGRRGEVGCLPDARRVEVGCLTEGRSKRIPSHLVSSRSAEDIISSANIYQEFDRQDQTRNSFANTILLHVSFNESALHKFQLNS